MTEEYHLGFQMWLYDLFNHIMNFFQFDWQ